MSYNGSGTFLINSTGQPVVANTVISATVFNALTADLASGLTNCITKDGQSTPTANIPMGSNKITGLANGTLINDAATLGQVQSTAAKLIGSISGVDTVLGIMSPTLTAYAAGQLFYYIAAGANTGAVTLNIDGLGAKAVTRDGSTALAAGDINSGEIVVVIYDGTRFQMINAANSFGNTTINGTLTVTGNTGLQANVSITSTLSVGGTFAVTGAATLGSTLAVTGKSDLPTVSTASINAAVAVVTTGTVTNLTSTSASIASVNAGVALLTTATVTDLTASGASIASANIGNLQFTAASIASINAGVAVVTNLTATSASIASANVGTAVITTGTVTSLTSTSASIASANAAVALVTTGTVTNLTSTSASIASANLGTAVVTTGTVTNLTATSASIASANAGTAVVTNLTATGASIASANVGTGVVTALTVTGASVASANVGTAVITTLTATGASVASINAGVALVTTGTVTNLTSTTASIASANIGVAAIGTLSFTGASIASLNAGTATITTGNLTFSSTGQRITGDMSNATIGNRLAFQTSTTNGNTDLQIIPNGTSVTSGIRLNNNSDTTNAGYVRMSLNSTEASISVDRNSVSGTYLPLGFNTGGSERMRLDTSGNLGIGTASPVTTFGKNLTLYNDANTGTIASNTYLLVQSLNRNGVIDIASSATGTGSVNFVTTPGTTLAAIAGDIANSALAFRTGGATERMRIDSSGNVGIGTASPATILNAYNASTAIISVDGDSTTQFRASRYSSNASPSQLLLRKARGTLASPTAVNTGDITGGVFFQAYGGTNHRNIARIDGFVETYTSDTNIAGAMLFYTNGGSTDVTERMRIDSSGNVGIGTASPAAKLDIGSGNLNFSSTGQRITGDFTNATLSNRLAFQTSTTNGNTIVGAFPNGTGTNARLQLFSASDPANASTASMEANATSSLVIINADKTGTGTYLPMTFYTGGSERMRIDASGNTLFGKTVTDVDTVGSRIDAGRIFASINTQETLYVRNTTAAAYRFYVDSAGTVFATNTTISAISDQRYKENIRDLDTGLDAILALKPRTFDWKEGKGKNIKDDRGFIAQEFEQVFPNLVDNWKDPAPEGEEPYKSVRQDLIPVLVKAIQELSAKVAALEAK